VKRILFVDDERNVLEGLRGLLHKQRKVWEMSFASSGEEALAILASGGPFDVVVSDMRMPAMSGAELLSRVQREHPHAVRIVLSGQTEQDVARRIVHVAHQFLAKPCDGRQVQQTIERACNLQALLAQPALRQVVGQIGQLPVKPAIYTALVAMLENPSSSLADAARVIERDIGTTTKILQVVNSAFFGLPHRVSDITSAVTYLGLEMVKALVLSVEMRSSQKGTAPPVGFDLDRMQEHGLLSARVARRLLTDRTAGQDAFSAAMVQGAGVLVLCAGMPALFNEIVAQSRATGAALPVVERERLGVTHAEIGAYLMGIWGLPYSVVEAVAYLNDPQRAGSTSQDIVTAVHVGSALAAELLPFDPARHLGPGIVLDRVYLESLALLPKLDGWRALARAELEGSGGRS
jgi:HD-like signal output (HDOD) protein/CheY-like chemotaxis protein